MTIAVSVYMIVYSHQLYAILAPVLRPFERRVPSREPTEETSVESHAHDVVVVGLGRYGGAIAVATNRPEQSQWPRAVGADIVLQPFRDTAQHAVELLQGQRRGAPVEVIEPEHQKDLPEP